MLNDLSPARSLEVTLLPAYNFYHKAGSYILYRLYLERKSYLGGELTHIKCYRSDSKIESLTHNSCYPRIRAYKGGVTYEPTIQTRIHGNYLSSVQKSDKARGEIRADYRTLPNLSLAQKTCHKSLKEF